MKEKGAGEPIHCEGSMQSRQSVSPALQPELKEELEQKTNFLSWFHFQSVSSQAEQEAECWSARKAEESIPDYHILFNERGKKTWICFHLLYSWMYKVSINSLKIFTIIFFLYKQLSLTWATNHISGFCSMLLFFLSLPHEVCSGRSCKYNPKEICDITVWCFVVVLSPFCTESFVFYFDGCWNRMNCCFSDSFHLFKISAHTHYII